MTKLGIGHQVTIAEKGRSQSGADGDDQHYAAIVLARSKAHFCQAGDVSIVCHVDRAARLF